MRRFKFVLTDQTVAYMSIFVHSFVWQTQWFRARLMTHVLFLKMKLNARHANAKAIPAVASMEIVTVRERSTETTSLDGTPSYGTPPGKVKLIRKLEKIGEKVW